MEDWEVCVIPKQLPPLSPAGQEDHCIILLFVCQGLSRKEYEAKKEAVADEIISRLEKKLFPGLMSSVVFREVSSKMYFHAY